MGKIHIHVVDSEYENSEDYADLWIKEDGTVIQVIDHRDTVYTIDGVSYAETVYVPHVLYPFNHFDGHVRDYLDSAYFTILDHSTSRVIW